MYKEHILWQHYWPASRRKSPVPLRHPTFLGFGPMKKKATKNGCGRFKIRGMKSSSFRSRFITTESQGDRLGPGPPGFLVNLTVINPTWGSSLVTPMSKKFRLTLRRRPYHTICGRAGRRAPYVVGWTPDLFHGGAAVFTCTLRVRVRGRYRGPGCLPAPVHATCLGLVGVQSLAMVRLGIQGKWVHVDVNQLGSRKKRHKEFVTTIYSQHTQEFDYHSQFS